MKSQYIVLYVVGLSFPALNNLIFFIYLKLTPHVQFANFHLCFNLTSLCTFTH